jgi:GT2 family glycosyltransferase
MLSVIIVNWNTREHLRECLRSIHAHGTTEPLEVIVVDNASLDGSAAMVAFEFPWVRLEASGQNLGYAMGNNLGFGVAKGEWLLTLNADTKFFDDSLQVAVDRLAAMPKAAVLAGTLLDADAKAIQRSVRSFPRPSAIIPEILGLSKFFPRQFGEYRQVAFDYTKAQEAEQPMGTFLLFRKSALDEVGVMDELFSIFFNEVDLLYRIKRAGWQIWYSPEVRIIHFGGQSTRQIPKKMVWESHRSLLRYYRKWYLKWWNAPLIWIFSAYVWLAAFIRARGWDAGFRY